MANKLPPNLLHIYDSEGSKYLVNCDKEKGFKITFEQEQNTAEHRDEFMEKNDEYIDVYSEINFRTQNSTWPLNFGGFDKKNGFYKKIILKYPFSWQGVMIDLLLRVISFWLYYTGLIGPIFFLLAQTLFAIIVLAGIQENAAKRQKLNLWNQLGFHPENWRSLDVESSSRIGGWLLFFAFLGQLVIQWQCMPVEWYFWLRILLIVLAGCVHSLTYSGLALNGLPYFFLQNRLSDELEMHHEHIDKNDVQIAQIQAKVDDLKQKIDTYTIESALMGALAISSYLAIFQTGVIKTKDLTLLQNKLWSTFHDFLFFRFSRSFTAFIDLFNQHTFLWALILFFAATCAILYLMLLISRKRVYSQIAEINVHLELSKTFNNKEEEIYNLSLQNSQNTELTHRQRRVTEQCDMHLKEAEKTLGLVLESTQILESLRKTATFLFILLICSSACFLTPYLGLAFLMVFCFMQLAFQRDLKNFNLKKRMPFQPDLKNFNLKKRKSKDEETKKSDPFKKLGSFNYKKGKYTLALEFFQKAAKIEETLNPESESMATTYHWVGNSYYELQSYDLALEFFQKAAKIEETLNPESESLATTYGNVGASYYALQSYDLALEFFQKAAKIRETLIPESESMATTYHWVGRSFHALQSYDLALEFFQKAAKIRETLIPESESLANTYFSLGETLEGLKRYNDALENFTKAYDLQKIGGTKFRIAVCQEALGNSLLALENYIASAEIRKEKIGADNPSTMDSVSNAVRLARELNRTAELPAWFGEEYKPRRIEY